VRRIIPIPAFRDNYIWAIREGGRAVVVDPGDAVPVLRFLEQERLELAAILVTHHHADHVGGVDELVAAHHVPVFGPAAETIPELTDGVRGGDAVALPGSGVRLRVIDVPGHTAGHIAYSGEGSLFCGDTLFACGCGRLFEGTAEQMLGSLDRLAALEGSTRVYCAHEYTLSNIRFARAVDPANAALAARESVEQAKRDRGEPTIPSTIADELATNPFLRVRDAAVIASATQHAGRALRDDVEVFATLRSWKNGF
jgi:hydroxyacylglutathione hydrolase